jgi:hypothetical protein
LNPTITLIDETEDSLKGLHAGLRPVVSCAMKRSIVTVVLLIAAAVFVWAQAYRVVPDTVHLEVRSVFPREVTPGKYEQVDQKNLQTLADQGWELVSVMPYVYRNEERGPELQGPKPVVTQTYPAYFFKRVRVPGARE